MRRQSGWRGSATRFAVAFKAGIPVADAVHLVAGDDEYFGKHLVRIGDDIHAGIPLHQALSNQGLFPPYLVSMIKVGETTGALDKVMESLAVYYEQKHSLRHEIKDALTYPLILISMVAAVVLVLTSKILPVFDDILAASGADMPVIARGLMNLGMFISSNIAWLAATPLVLGLIFWVWKSTPEGKETFARFQAETKILNGIFPKIYAARVSSVMWYALESGLDVGKALEMAAQVAGNGYVAKQLAWCRQKIEKGNDLAECFNSVNIFPSSFVNMVRVGHKTGNYRQWPEDGCYTRTRYWTLHGAVSRIEPVLVSALSVVIGVVLIAVVLLISIMSSMG